MSRLLKLYDEGDIDLVIPNSVKKEIGHPKTPPHVKSSAQRPVYTNETSLTPDQVQRRSEIRLLVQGNAKPEQHVSDADHIFDLVKHGGGYFITTDDRLLRLSEKLFRQYSVTTIKPCAYEQKLQENT